MERSMVELESDISVGRFGSLGSAGGDDSTTPGSESTFTTALTLFDATRSSRSNRAGVAIDRRGAMAGIDPAVEVPRFGVASCSSCRSVRRSLRKVTV
jgi:hypothetical protein